MDLQNQERYLLRAEKGGKSLSELDFHGYFRGCGEWGRGGECRSFKNVDSQVPQKTY